MVAVPADTPETRPDGPTVAMPILLLLHDPPAVGQESDVLLPRQVAAVPEIAAGKILTVTLTLFEHPPARE